VYSLRPGPELVRGFRAEALAHVWSTDDGWRVRFAGRDARPLVVGDTWEVGSTEVEVVAQPMPSTPATVADDRFGPPLRIVARFETVHIHPKGRAVVVITGIRARIVTELVGYAVPVPWEHLAVPIWPDAARRVQRMNWDRHLKALRNQLRDVGLRTDLVRADGRGNVELLLMPDDEVIDEG
jgi:hypothetical protein